MSSLNFSDPVLSDSPLQWDAEDDQRLRELLDASGLYPLDYSRRLRLLEIFLLPWQQRTSFSDDRKHTE